MDHPTSLPREYPWRTTAMVAAGLAAFELVLLVMLSLAFLARPLLDRGDGERPRAEPAASAPAPAGKAAATPATKPAPEPKLPREATTIIVLNGNGSPGAAGDKADLVRSRGYVIAGTANAPRTDFARSVVMFRPGYRAEALRLARDFKVARVTPLDGLQAADLQGAHLALIVGAS